MFQYPAEIVLHQPWFNTEKQCICLASYSIIHIEYSEEMFFEESLSTQNESFINCKAVKAVLSLPSL